MQSETAFAARSGTLLKSRNGTNKRRKSAFTCQTKTLTTLFGTQGTTSSLVPMRERWEQQKQTKLKVYGCPRLSKG